MSRELRGEMLSLRQRVSEKSNPSFSDEECEQLSAALTHSDPKTRKMAVRALEKAPPASVPVTALESDIVRVIDEALESDDIDSRKAAKGAARLLFSLDLESQYQADGLTDLAEQMLAEGTPHLGTGGALLLGPSVQLRDATLSDDVVSNLVDHVIKIELTSDDYAQRSDHIRPAISLLSEAAEDHHDAIEPVLETLTIDEYLHGPFTNARQVSARLLYKMAERAPDTVTPYLLDLCIRLRDLDNQVVLHAASGLSELGEQQGTEQLRPLLQTVEIALEHDELPALAGTLRVLSVVADDKPSWIGELPIDSVDALRTHDAISDDLQVRSWLVKTVGGYALATDEEAVGPPLIDFAFETLAYREQDQDVLIGNEQLATGTSEAVTAAPQSCLKPLMQVAGETALSGTDALSDVGDIPSLVLGDEVISAAPETELTVADVADATSAMRLSRYQLATHSIRHALLESADARTQLQSLVTDTDQPIQERRLGAEGFMLWVADDTSDSAGKGASEVFTTLQAADDEALAAIGDWGKTVIQ